MSGHRTFSRSESRKTCESFICQYKKGRVSASIKSRSDIQHYMLEDKKGPLKPLKREGSLYAFEICRSDKKGKNISSSSKYFFNGRAYIWIEQNICLLQKSVCLFKY